MYTSVATCGRYDNITKFDAMFLEHARSLGDDLVVILYNDIRVKSGSAILGRNELARAISLEQMDCVDSVIISSHGREYRQEPYAEYSKDDLSVGYELEQLRPHLFLTNSDQVMKHNESVCKLFEIPLEFILLEDYYKDE